ncbi:4Fe-4S dicluster domain-containing protein [bacterium]|nr:4Fe-4S dicluster domain-containing protein [bacterium]
MASRRDFLRHAGFLTGTAVAATTGVKKAAAAHGPHIDDDRMGVLCDFTLCIGCRSCEYACSEAHDLPHGDFTDYSAEDAVLESYRRPTPDDLTVINRFSPAKGHDEPFHAKYNCLHCDHPVCVSACIVGALEKNARGPVTYDAWKCIGCRYCIQACPFQIPTYEYDDALTPKVVKCDLCQDRTLEGGIPACVDICPQETMVFGRRSDLIKLAHERITVHPERYVDHVYGEHEVGGTSWLYLADRSFQDLTLPEVPDESPAVTTERIQHGIFRGFSGPLMVFALVSVIMKSAGRNPEETQEDDHE